MVRNDLGDINSGIGDTFEFDYLFAQFQSRYDLKCLKDTL